MSENTERIKCLIIGSGPAGYTAAIYAARADMHPVMYTGLEPGGQLTTTTEVDNFPGYPEGVDGPAMMIDLQKQAERFGTQVRMGMVTEVEFSKEVGGIHKACVDNATWLEAETVIISTGATAKYLGLPSEQRLRGGGVSACAVCDGFFYKNKEVAVIGGGDTALEETIFLSNICSKVYLVHRRDKFRAAPNTIERVKKLENVEFVLNATIIEAYGDAMGVAGLKVSTPEGERDLPVPGIFTFVGMNVNNQVLKKEDGSFICDVNEAGEVIVDLRMRTSTPGLYAAGDIRIDAPKQVVCAAGDGAVAAVNVIPYLDEKVNG